MKVLLEEVVIALQVAQDRASLFTYPDDIQTDLRMAMKLVNRARQRLCDEDNNKHVAS